MTPQSKEYRIITLSRGYEAIVDEQDYTYLSQFTWWVRLDRNMAYAFRRTSRRHFVQMHREVLGIVDPCIFVDHRNRDGLDNRRENLRTASNAQNQWNTKISKSNRSGFKGVCFNKKVGRWQADIKINRVRKYLGLFDTAEDASKAYINAAIIYHGEFVGGD